MAESEPELNFGMLDFWTTGERYEAPTRNMGASRIIGCIRDDPVGRTKIGLN